LSFSQVSMAVWTMSCWEAGKLRAILRSTDALRKALTVARESFTEKVTRSTNLFACLFVCLSASMGVFSLPTIAATSGSCSGLSSIHLRSAILKHLFEQFAQIVRRLAAAGAHLKHGRPLPPAVGGHLAQANRGLRHGNTNGPGRL